jgi:hypothetical protein
MPETTTEKLRYVNYPVEPDLFDGLGLGPGEVGVRDIREALQGLHGITKAARPLGISEPIQVAAAVTRYATAVAEARRSLSKRFDRAEWNLMADVCNGTLDLMDYSETPMSFRMMLLANVEDGHKLDGTGANWFDEEEADTRVAALLGKIHKLSTIEADAIGVAIREFWANTGIDHQVEEWWLPDRGRKAKRKAARDAG